MGIAKHVCATSHPHFLTDSDLVLCQVLIKSNMYCGRAVSLIKHHFYSLPYALESEMNNARSVLDPFDMDYDPLLTSINRTHFVMPGLFDGHVVADFYSLSINHIIQRFYSSLAHLIL